MARSIFSEEHEQFREQVRRFFDKEVVPYYRDWEKSGLTPRSFWRKAGEAGLLCTTLPEEYGGGGGTFLHACVVTEEMARAGANLGIAVHSDMVSPYLMHYASPSLKQHLLPRLCSGEIVGSIGMTEPGTGSDLKNIRTTAVRDGDDWVINGQKVWISRVQHSDLLILLARTTPISEVERKSDGLSCFIIELDKAIGNGLTVRPILNMVNHETNELFFDNLELPEDALLGQEGKGLKVIFEGLNAERTLIAAECIGDGYWFIERARNYANERKVFGRPIGQNQGIQFPLAESFIELEAASLMRWRACEKIDARQNAGVEANMAKYLAAKASWEAANACLQTHGGFGFACEYDVERKFRETRLYQVAPISTNMILSHVAEHVLKLPRSF